MTKTVDLEAEEQAVKIKTRIAIGVALLIIAVCVCFTTWLMKSHLENLQVSTRATPNGVFGMEPNEWGDLAAGIGSSIALVFISLGLFLQMMELRFQRLEMRANREEQEEATAALEASNQFQRLISQFQILDNQITSQPDLSFAIMISHVRRLNNRDVLKLYILNNNKNGALVRDVSFASTEGLGDPVAKENGEAATIAVDMKERVLFQFWFAAPSLTKTDEFNGLFTIHYQDKLGYDRSLTIKYENGVVIERELSEDMRELERERYRLAAKIRTAGKTDK